MHSQRAIPGQGQRSTQHWGRGQVRALRLLLETLEDRRLLSGSRLGFETRVAPAEQAALFAQSVAPLSSPAVAVHDDSSFAIAYTNHDEPLLGDEVYLRRFDSDRSPALENDLVPVVDDGLGDQDGAVVASLPDGGVVVAWYDRGCAENVDQACAAPFDATDSIFARRFDGAGNPIDAEPWRVNADSAGGQSQVAVAADSDGIIALAWTGSDLEGLGGVWLRHFDANGEPLEPTDLRIFTGNGVTESPTTALDDAGNLAVAWSVRDSFDDSSEIHGLYFSAAGDAPIELQIAADDALNPRWPSLDMDGAGNLVVAFTQDTFTSEAGTSSDVYARRFEVGGAPLDAAPFCVNTSLAGDQEIGRVAVASDGSFLITWSGSGDQPGEADENGVFVQGFERAGEPTGGETRVNSTLAGEQAWPSIGVSAIGDAVITWAGVGDQNNTAEIGDQSDEAGVFFQQVDFVVAKGEIDVRGQGISIVDGDTEPSTADGTILGNAVVNEGRLTQTFVIHNIGDGRLWFLDDPGIKVVGGEDGEFSVEYDHTASIGPHGSLAFTLSFAPAATGLRKATIVILTDDGDETPFEFDVQGIGLVAARPWQNPSNPYDVNGDGVVTGLDVLILINHINKNGPHELAPPADGDAPPPYLDVNGDNRITPLDALQTINILNARRPPLSAPDQAVPMQGVMSARLVGGAGDKVRRNERSTDLVFSNWADAALDRLTGRKSTRRYLS